jgi:transposase
MRTRLETAERRRRIADLAQAGLTTSQLAARFGISVRSAREIALEGNPTRPASIPARRRSA